MSLFEEMARLQSQGVAFAVATVVETGGSSPQKAGARVVVLADGSVMGTVGGGAVEHRVVQAARELLADPGAATRLLKMHLTHDLGMCCGGSMSVFLEKVPRAERLVVFGAGHVAKPLVAFARSVGFAVTVVDEREDWLTQDRFPDAERLLAHAVDAARTVAVDEGTFACVVTHDHRLDQEVVEALLRRPLAWLGMIGSVRKGLRFRQRLEAAGFSPGEIARMKSPVGVAIGAQTPEEIAVSIVAELVAVRRGVGAQVDAQRPAAGKGAPETEEA